MAGCSRLRKFPDFSTNISSLKLSNTLVEQVPASIQHWTRLRFLDLSYNEKLKTLENLPEGASHLNLSYSGIEKVSDCIKGLHGLQHFNLSGCRKLESLPELPPQLIFKICLVVAPNHQIREYRVSQLLCRRIDDQSVSEIVFEFSSKLHDFEIVECGVQILTDEIERSAMCLNPAKRLKTTLSEQ
ncbi:ADP-ribosyl cyclase/cyclic ADP-ribose hydrolase [Raphanus sativus]|nr:ADP-ribosyl cyclase/cyclic ADP-ribose hydrolase [Raphanus sativus]